MITYGTASSDNDLQQILYLQNINLPDSISEEQARSQGFVTVRHHFGLLKKMNSPYPHIVARDGDRIIGYALVMLRKFEQEIPVLLSMFEKINELVYKGVKLEESSYFIMGQVCIDEAYRGRWVFAGLYDEMRRRMAPSFDYIVTEVALRNTRSMRAHKKIGFESILSYEDSEKWELILIATK